MNTRLLGKPALRLALAFILATAFGGVAACPALADTTASPDGQKADSAVTLRIGWNQKVDSLNPFIGLESVSYALYHLNYDHLTEPDPKTLQPIPALAESWTSNDDFTTWTFRLRRDVEWQDGEPLTAADVVFSIDLNLSDEVSNYDMYVGGIESCRALDDSTVRITCKDPMPRILTNFTLVPIVPRHIWGKMTLAEASRKFQNPAPVIGSGPFQIVEFQRDKFVRLKANPQFWGPRPRVDEIIFQMYTNNDTLASDLKSGLIQGGNLQAAAYRALKGAPGLETSLSHENGFDELGFNCYDSDDSLGNPVLRDPAFRRALGWAIDRERIAAIAWDGFAEPATSVIPADFYDESLDYHWEPPADTVSTYDPARCRQLLDQAGYKDSDGDGIREDQAGKPIELRLWAASDKPEYASAAKFITGWLGDVGLRISMQVMDDGALSDRQYNYKGSTFAPDFDLFVWGWQTGEFDPGFLLSLFTSDQIEAWSDCNYSNAAYDERYAAQDRDGDERSRLSTVHDMQAILYEDTPYIPLVYPLTREVYSSAWEGWVRQPSANGSVWNRNTYLAVHPVAGAAQEPGSPKGMYTVAGACAAGAIAAVLIVVARRRSAAREEETG